MLEDHSFMGLLIPIVAIVMSLGVAFWAIYWDFRAKQIKQRERELMIERGMVPSETGESKRPPVLEEYLRKGIVMVFLGIGLWIGYLVLLYSAGPPAWICGVGGAIVGLVGIGNLLYYAIAKKLAKQGGENSRASVP